MDKKPVSGQEGQNGLFASAVLDKNNNTYILKIVNTSEKNQKLNIEFKGLKKSETLINGKCITLHSDDVDAENSLDEPNKIVPIEKDIIMEKNILKDEIGEMTFAVYKFKISRN